MRTKILVMVVLVVGCTLFPNLVPPKDDSATGDFVAASWRGRPVADMETHPVFSMLKTDRQDASDGSTIYHHVRCTDWEDTQQASQGLTPYGGGLNAQQTQQSSQRGQVCCDRQFVARGGVIQEYRQVPMGGTCTVEKRYAAAAGGGAPQK
jgi:hypothetical protein